MRGRRQRRVWPSLLLLPFAHAACIVTECLCIWACEHGWFPPRALDGLQRFPLLEATSFLLYCVWWVKAHSQGPPPTAVQAVATHHQGTQTTAGVSEEVRALQAQIEDLKQASTLREREVQDSLFSEVKISLSQQEEAAARRYVVLGRDREQRLLHVEAAEAQLRQAYNEADNRAREATEQNESLREDLRRLQGHLQTLTNRSYYACSRYLHGAVVLVGSNEMQRRAAKDVYSGTATAARWAREPASL